MLLKNGNLLVARFTTTRFISHTVRQINKRFWNERKKKHTTFSPKRMAATLEYVKNIETKVTKYAISTFYRRVLKLSITSYSIVESLPVENPLFRGLNWSRLVCLINSILFKWIVSCDRGLGPSKCHLRQNG